MFDVQYVAIVLKYKVLQLRLEVPNNNGTTRVTNNVRLTTMGTQQFSMVASHHAEYSRKADLQEMRINNMKTRKVCVDRNKLCSLAGRSIVWSDSE